MLLELITGRRPVRSNQSQMDDSLVDWVSYFSKLINFIVHNTFRGFVKRKAILSEVMQFLSVYILIVDFT